MKKIQTFCKALLILVCSATVHANTGRILTEIGSIPDDLTLRLASKPAATFRPDAEGRYTFTPAASDFVFIIPDAGDEFIYSPRIIPAGQVGADTLYIIPPTLTEYTIIVENFTNFAFEFFTDKAIISEALETAKKDYQLEIIPRRNVTAIYVAAVAAGYPAVVQKVDIVPNQRRGYMKILPADLGIKVRPQAPIEEIARPVVAPPVIVKEAPPPKPVVEIEKAAKPLVEEERTSEPEPRVEETPIIETQTKDQQIPATAQLVQTDMPALFFNNRLILKDPDNMQLLVQGEYVLFSSPNNISYAGASIGLHNIRFYQQSLDLFAHVAASPEFDGILYEGTLIWNPSRFIALDATHHRASSEAWNREYFVSRTSFGLNGNYLLKAGFGQFGIGARFRLDFGNFDRYVENAVENSVRYLPSIYLLSIFDFANSTVGIMLGAVNEAIYFSANYAFQHRLGLSYTWKSSSQANELLSPLEQDQQHKISASYYFTLIQRK